MIADEILDHSGDAKKRRLEQYKNTVNVEKILDIYLPLIQELEGVLHDLFLNRLDLNTIVGQQLDEVGFIVDELRQGRDDETYRSFLFIKIGINTSQGEPERVINIFKLLTDSAYVHYLNLGRAEMELEGTMTFADQDEINFIFDNVHRFVAAGTRLNSIRCHDETEAFSFSGPDNDPASKGFGKAGEPLVGGKFSTPYKRALPFAFKSTDPNKSNDPQTEGFGSGDDPLVGGQFV